MQDDRSTPPSAAPSRSGMNGIVLLVLLVAAGMGITGAYFQWKAPAILARAKAEQEAAPKHGEARVERWIEFGRSLVHQRLLQLRLSAEHPWLVTHAHARADRDEAPVLYGVDLRFLSVDWVVREGMDVVVEIPAAGRLGQAWLGADHAQSVPKVDADAPAPTSEACAERARAIVEWALERIAKALPRDIEGSRLIVRVGLDRAAAASAGTDQAPAPGFDGARAAR